MQKLEEKVEKIGKDLEQNPKVKDHVESSGDVEKPPNLKPPIANDNKFVDGVQVSVNSDEEELDYDDDLVEMGEEDRSIDQDGSHDRSSPCSEMDGNVANEDTSGSDIQ